MGMECQEPNQPATLTSVERVGWDKKVGKVSKSGVEKLLINSG